MIEEKLELVQCSEEQERRIYGSGFRGKLDKSDFDFKTTGSLCIADSDLDKIEFQGDQTGLSSKQFTFRVEKCKKNASC